MSPTPRKPQDAVELRPSSLPRPVSTPTKTNSIMTPRGFSHSPRSSPSRFEPGSPTPTKNRTPPHALLMPSRIVKPPTTAEDLKLLKEKTEAKRKYITELQNSIYQTRNSLQKLEFLAGELDGKRHEIGVPLGKLKSDLEGIQESRRLKKKSIERDYEAKRHQMKQNNELSIANIENNYKTECGKILALKTDEINARKDVLKKQISDIRYEIKNNDLFIQRQIKQISDEHATSWSELEAYLIGTRESIEKDTAEVVKENENVGAQILELEEEHKALKESKADRMKKLSEMEKENFELTMKKRTLHERTDQLRVALSDKQDAINRLKQDMQWKIETKIQLDDALINEEERRRKLHNRLQELKGNIRVFCRIRPKIPSEMKEDLLQVQVPDNDEAKQEIDILDAKSFMTSSSSSLSQSTPNNIKKYTFKFDKVFQQNNTNPEIFEEISQLVQSALYGFNICIFAYGQTGSGKTFTMSAHDGVIPQTIRQIFDSCHHLSKRDWEYTISGEFLEIHNENIHDLLSEQSGNTIADAKKYEIKHDQQSKTTYITNLTRIDFQTPEEMNTTLQRALNNRSIASTKSNEQSSRSHTVCIIRLHGTNTVTGETINSVLNLIDLAGSERINQSGVSGDRLKETQAINKSLSCLGDVIYALGDENAKHIPFRNSKLTYLLQYSLIEDSKTLMFVNVSPLANNLNETVNSLRFATKVNSTGLQRKS